MLEHFKNVEEFLAPALLILLGLLSRLWQNQIKDRSEAKKAVLEARQREEELKVETEKLARQERIRLADALETERADRKREIDLKMAGYERELTGFRKQADLDQREQRLMVRRVEDLQNMLGTREREVAELKERVSRLQEQIKQMEGECQRLRGLLARENPPPLANPG